MGISLGWMRPEAPYAPIATAGLLSALADGGTPARAIWKPTPTGISLEIETLCSLDEVAEAIAVSPWPDLESIQWPGKLGQAIKPMLADSGDAVVELQRLRSAAQTEGKEAELKLLNCLVTESALDDSGLPGRNRLLRGVKSDLSSIREKVKIDRDSLKRELLEGPVWVNGKSGRGLGLVPELQTFGGSTGREPSQVGSHSVLLFRLLWLGILSLPPSGVMHRGRRVVGGPLVTNPSAISWPIWTVALGLEELKSYFCLAEIHSEAPNSALLNERGVKRVYTSTSVPINSMISVFRWGRRVI